LGILFVGRRGTLGVWPGAEARRRSRAVIVRPVMRGKKKGKEKGGADRWGRPVREKEGERARAPCWR
jgi:hypothetical protein